MEDAPLRDSAAPQGIPEDQLEAMESRLAAASAGPWKSWIEGRDHTSGDSFIMTGPEGNRGEDIYLLGATDADQDFIAAARQDVPTLLAEVRRLKAIIDSNG